MTTSRVVLVRAKKKKSKSLTLLETVHMYSSVTDVIFTGAFYNKSGLFRNHATTAYPSELSIVAGLPRQVSSGGYWQS